VRALVFLVVALATPAHAAPASTEPIVLASEDRAFEAALRDALAPAGMTLILVRDASPAAIGDFVGASRALADREHATSTVWLIAAREGATLVAYDRDVDRVLVRTLPYRPPLDASQAAEAARTVRTMLRALRVTPDSDLAPPHAEDAAAVRARSGAIDRTLLALDVDAGVRVNGPGAVAAPTGGLTVIWRPEALGVAASARFAPAADVATSAITGRISDESFAVAARYPRWVAPEIELAGSAAAAVHIVRLHGQVATGGIDKLRLDPAARLGITATYALGRVLGVGIGMSSDVLLRRQQYTVGDDRVLTVPRVQVSAGVVFTARIL